MLGDCLRSCKSSTPAIGTLHECRPVPSHPGLLQVELFIRLPRRAPRRIRVTLSAQPDLRMHWIRVIRTANGKRRTYVRFGSGIGCWFIRGRVGRPHWNPIRVDDGPSGGGQDGNGNGSFQMGSDRGRFPGERLGGIPVPGLLRDHCRHCNSAAPMASASSARPDPRRPSRIEGSTYESSIT